MDFSKGNWKPVDNPYGDQKDRPWHHAKVQILRDGWDEIKNVAWSDLHPVMNVSGLYWRPIPPSGKL